VPAGEEEGLAQGQEEEEDPSQRPQSPCDGLRALPERAARADPHTASRPALPGDHQDAGGGVEQAAAFGEAGTSPRRDPRAGQHAPSLRPRALRSLPGRSSAKGAQTRAWASSHGEGPAAPREPGARLRTLCDRSGTWTKRSGRSSST